MKTLLLILQHFMHCALESSPLYWRYTVPSISFVVGMLPGMHFLWWHSVLLSHFPESPVWFGNDAYSKSDEQFVHMRSSADVARRLMLIVKRDTWQFVAKTWRYMRSVAATRSLCWLARYLKSSVSFWTHLVCLHIKYFFSKFLFLKNRSFYA